MGKRCEFFDENKIKELFENTNLSKREISKEVLCRCARIRDYLDRTYSKEYLRERHLSMIKEKRSGENSHMKGKFGELHHNYKGRVADGRGYWMVLKPDWYTGRRSSKHVFEHSVIMCQSLGITEIPEDFLVHHIDEDGQNNDLNNLELMSRSAHQKLHCLKAQRLSEKSREV